MTIYFIVSIIPHKDLSLIQHTFIALLSQYNSEDFSGLVLFQIWLLITNLLHQFYANELDPISEIISAIFAFYCTSPGSCICSCCVIYALQVSVTPCQKTERYLDVFGNYCVTNKVIAHLFLSTNYMVVAHRITIKDIFSRCQWIIAF